jgi:hypothetical protein
MAGLYENLDELSLAAIVREIQAMPFLGAKAALDFMRTRHRIDLSHAVQGLGAEGGGQRLEWTQLLREGRCFGFGLSQPAVAAQNSIILLNNPATTGVRALVFLIVVEAGAASDGVILTAPVGTLGTGGIGAGFNLRDGAQNSLCTIFAGTSAGGFGGQIFRLRNSQANAALMFPPGDAQFFYEVGPGALGQFTIVNNNLNSVLAAAILWAEVPSNQPAPKPETHVGGYP